MYVGLPGGGKGGPGPRYVKDLLEARGDGRKLWEVQHVSMFNFLAVDQSVDVVVEAADAGFLVVEGVLLLRHVQRWSMERGTFPNPREVCLRISLRGPPLILCDEGGIPLLVKPFAAVEEGSLCFAPEGSLTAVDVTVRACSSTDIPLVISFSLGGEAFIVRVFIQHGILQGRGMLD